jgi:hypothetical protein
MSHSRRTSLLGLSVGDEVEVTNKSDRLFGKRIHVKSVAENGSTWTAVEDEQPRSRSDMPWWYKRIEKPKPTNRLGIVVGDVVEVLPAYNAYFSATSSTRVRAGDLITVKAVAKSSWQAVEDTNPDYPYFRAYDPEWYRKVDGGMARLVAKMTAKPGDLPKVAAEPASGDIVDRVVAMRNDAHNWADSYVMPGSVYRQEAWLRSFGATFDDAAAEIRLLRERNKELEADKGARLAFEYGASKHGATVKQGMPHTLRDAQLEILKLRTERDALEQLRPAWAQGYSTASIAAQVSGDSLSRLWKMLGVTDQTMAVLVLGQLLKNSDARLVDQKTGRFMRDAFRKIERDEKEPFVTRALARAAAEGISAANCLLPREE